MLGAHAVGKTSLVRRYVEGVFSDRYLTTLGVKISRKEIRIGDQELTLLLWDLAGEDAFNRVPISYLRGSSACLLVVDGTRPETLRVALELRDRATAAVGEIPFVMALNKNDLNHAWTLDPGTIDALAEQGWRLIRTSARLGEGVEEAFRQLARGILGS